MKHLILLLLVSILSFPSFAISPITGSTIVCPGSTTTLTDATSGGAWSSSSTAIAFVSGTGVVYGIAPGTTIITYTVSGVGSDTITITVSTDCNVFPVFFYNDLNGDCVKEITEPFNGIPVTVVVDSSGIPIDTLSTTRGLYYKALGGVGTIYSFSILPGNTYVSCPASGIWYDTVQSSTVYTYPVNYVALNCSSSSVFDLAVNAFIPVTGQHDQIGAILVYNNFCTPTNATVTLHYSPKYSSFPSFPASSSLGTIIWHLTGLSADSTNPVCLPYQVYAPNTANLTAGDTVNEYITVTPTIGDVDTLNNNIVIIDTVKASCDPNYMLVTPNCFTTDTQFQYTINFENTGNDTAHNIYVMDTLSDYLDVQSLRIVIASAVMDMEVFKYRAHNIVKFNFPNINLLDSSHHSQCDGAVIFAIKNKPGLPNGTIISNKAGIYFDINPVVLTNAVENTKGCPTAVPIINNTRKVDIYPNPTTDELTIKMDKDAYTSCVITNSMGQVLIQQPLSTTLTKVNVKILPAGLYYITVKGDNGSKVQKFVKL